ncbi:MAG TPA: PilZ domain-containing protein [Terriglobales bacterium]|nr:PilZ domain-containing protein [Terriglobales bacterium]
MHVQTSGNTAAEQHSHERRYLRYFMSAPVNVRRPFRSGSRLTRGLTLEISLGGLSAVLCGPPPVGERVSLRWKVLDIAFEARAIVRHSNSARTGFEFINLSRASSRRIESCIQRSLLCPWPRESGIPAATQ